MSSQNFQSGDNFIFEGAQQSVSSPSVLVSRPVSESASSSVQDVSLTKRHSYFKDWRVQYSYQVRNGSIIEKEETVSAMSPISAMREVLQRMKNSFPDNAYIDRITVRFDAEASGVKFKTPKRRNRDGNASSSESVSF